MKLRIFQKSGKIKFQEIECQGFFIDLEKTLIWVTFSDGRAPIKIENITSITTIPEIDVKKN